MKNKEYSKSCSYIFYRYYSEEGIIAAKNRMGCHLTHLKNRKANRYMLLKSLKTNNHGRR